MNIWELDIQFVQGGKSAFATLHTTSTADAARLDNFKGSAWPADEWTPLQLVRNPLNKDEAASQELGDWAMINVKGSILNLSQRALDAVLPQIAHCGQVLPVQFDEAPYVIFNVTRVIDALDEPASAVVYFPSSGRVAEIEKFVFKPEAVKDEWIFKIPQRPGAHNFVTDRFVELVRHHKLTGFDFQRVWSDEEQEREAA